jgi:threonine dehydrogenase-like Zn-dependent dehydrogenase
VLIQGPGQQGLCQVVTARNAGADVVIISGTSKDARRLEMAKELGADVVINVDTHDVVEEVLKATGGIGVDVSIDCTAGAGTKALHVGLDALKPKAGTLVIQGNEMKTFPDFPIEKLTLKYVTIKSARGHSYKACEGALKQLASHRFPIEKALTHNYSLDQVDLAIRSVGGTGDKDVIHVNVQPWKESAA